MKNSLRLLVLSGTLALLASPVFADSSGPGGSIPPTGGTSTTNSTSSTTTTLTEVLSIIESVGL